MTYLVRGEFISFYSLQSSMRIVRTRTQAGKLEASSLTNAKQESCLLLAPHGLLSFVWIMTWDYLPRAGTAQGVLGPPTSITNKAAAHRLTIWWGHFFN